MSGLPAPWVATLITRARAVLAEEDRDCAYRCGQLEVLARLLCDELEALTAAQPQSR